MSHFWIDIESTLFIIDRVCPRNGQLYKWEPCIQWTEFSSLNIPEDFNSDSIFSHDIRSGKLMVF